jgi:hypothetical protein
MQASKRDFDTTTNDEADDVSLPRSPEDFADQFWVRAALLGLCIASVIAAIWFARTPSFEKCSAIENVADRNACYDQLRQDLLKPPAKGANIPISQRANPDVRFGS